MNSKGQEENTRMNEEIRENIEKALEILNNPEVKTKLAKSAIKSKADYLAKKRSMMVPESIMKRRMAI